jgi:hypothetical protein
VAEQSLFGDLFEAGEGKKTTIELSHDDIKADWSEDFELIESIVGIDAAFKIAEAFAGSTIYIPKNILAAKIYYDIRKKFNSGASYRELSVEYGYTETHIRNIIHRK